MSTSFTWESPKSVKPLEGYAILAYRKRSKNPEVLKCISETELIDIDGNKVTLTEIKRWSYIHTASF